MLNARLQKLQPGISFTLAVPNENPPVRDRVNYTNKLFEQKKVLILDHCKWSIRDRELVGWKRTSSNMEGFHIDKSKKDLSHLSDAGDYALWNTRTLCIDEEDRGPMIVTSERRERRNWM